MVGGRVTAITRGYLQRHEAQHVVGPEHVPAHTIHHPTPPRTTPHHHAPTRIDTHQHAPTWTNAHQHAPTRTNTHQHAPTRTNARVHAPTRTNTVMGTGPCMTVRDRLFMTVHDRSWSFMTVHERRRRWHADCVETSPERPLQPHEPFNCGCLWRCLVRKVVINVINVHRDDGGPRLERLPRGVQLQTSGRHVGIPLAHLHVQPTPWGVCVCVSVGVLR